MDVSQVERRRRNARRARHLRGEHSDPIDVAPGPLLAGLERPDDRVTRGVRMRGRMPVRRLVAAADVPAIQANPQVEPLLSRCEALLAPVDGVRKFEELDATAMAAPKHEGSVAGNRLAFMT